MTTAELIAELNRRSIGCLVVTVGVAEGNTDSWHVSLKGQPPLIAALSAALNIQLAQHIENARDGLNGPGPVVVNA